MACPAGCVGGGGEPKHEAEEQLETLQKRIQAIYEREKTKSFVKSHENPAVQQVYDECIQEPLSEMAHHLLHTHYTPRKFAQ
jgi:iron only hydrogenase large subunit-like protein